MQNTTPTTTGASLFHAGEQEIQSRISKRMAGFATVHLSVVQRRTRPTTKILTALVI